MGDSYATWPVCEAPGSGMRTYFWCMSWLFGAQSLWWDGLISLDAGRWRGGGSLVLPELDVPGFINFPWEGLPFLRG